MTYTTQLADFAHQTKFEDLPTSVVDTTKLLILDTLICGLAAQDFQRSEMARKIFEELGGPGEATVFGASARLPALSAAMVNADMMNLLDVDDTFFSSAISPRSTLPRRSPWVKNSGVRGRTLSVRWRWGSTSTPA